MSTRSYGKSGAAGGRWNAAPTIGTADRGPEQLQTGEPRELSPDDAGDANHVLAECYEFLLQIARRGEREAAQ